MSGDEPADDTPTPSGYDRLAEDADGLERWESPWADSHYQRHYVWPAVRPLLPDVAGATVLDAGCGVGHYAAWFADRGADVVAVDASSEALDRARARGDDGTTFHEHDLTEPLAFASEGAFDLVFCNLVLDHLEDWHAVFAEFARVLAPGGSVVATTIHPFRRYLNHADELTSYYETEGLVGEWGSTDARIESFYRPVSEVVDAVVSAGLSIEAFREPRPTEALREHQPERFEEATRRPDTLCVRAALPDD